MKNVITKFWQELTILLLTGVIFLTNLTPGSYLVGWDSLQTELDPILGIKRAFFSAWQEFQSFGLTAGMAHAADLVRAVFILPFTLLLPNWLVRYSFHILMLLLAGLGALKLLRFSGLKKEASIFALAGSIFYMFNYATIQMMFIPFEAFSVFFAALPWLLWIYLCVLQKDNITPKHWLLFILVNILATPSFVAQQLFVVYGMILVLLTLGLLISKPWMHIFRRAIWAAIFIVIVNAFWLLPQVYFLGTNGDVVRESKINQIATEDVLYSNQDRGNITDFLTFTGFFNDRLDQNQNLLFASWHTHRENPVLIGVMILLIGIMLLGIVKKSKYQIPFVLAYLLMAVALLSNTEPILTLNEMIRSQTFINQVFRSPFTKFAIPHALIGAYFFAFGLFFLSQLISRLTHITGTHASLIAKLTGGIAISLILFQALPVFQGQYISPTMKVVIPDRYFALMEHMNSQDANGRIALLPDYTFWGWMHTTWGYNGSGFLWYGIENPIVSRNFDYWSFESEGYFWEVKQAIEAEDIQAFEAVLRKYDIDYIIFDESLLPLVADQKSLQYDSLESMLLQSRILKEEKKWEQLTLFRINPTNKREDFVSVATDVPNLGPRIKMTNDDTAYQTYGAYQTTNKKPYDSFFPFLDLMTQTRDVSDNWQITERSASFAIESSLPIDTNRYETIFSPQTTIDLYEDETAVKYIMPLESDITQERVALSFPKIQIDSFSPEKAAVGHCLREMGNLSYSNSGTQISITSRNGAKGCIELKDASLDQRYGYLVNIQHENQKGLGLYFYILDTTKEQAYVEDRLKEPNEYYILGPHFSKGLGYSFTFQNASYHTIPSTNILQDLSIYLMPYDQVRSYELKRKDTEVETAGYVEEFTATKRNYDSYQVTLPSANNERTIILSQSFQPGWKAYTRPNNTNFVLSIAQTLFPSLFGKELTEHVVINNWANGWTIPGENNQQTIVLKYMPQYLQYAGFSLLVISLVIMLVLASKQPQDRAKRLDKESKNHV